MLFTTAHKPQSVSACDLLSFSQTVCEEFQLGTGGGIDVHSNITLGQHFFMIRS